MINKKEDIEDNTFMTLIGEMGQFYSITVYFEKKKGYYIKATFIDSLKILPFTVEEIAKSFDLPISKLEIDYNKSRSQNHILSKEEKEYIKNDVLIVAKALYLLFNENLKKMTIGSNAVLDFKSLIEKSRFNHLFPELDYTIDKDIRQSYKGRIYIFKSNI